ncbi:MAG TPA: hypothetical protein VN493_24640 [Thermoanaerobaculia bacterium]|nr:hypothetical protein [Thermoanaerobaculia bacterium]
MRWRRCAAALWLTLALPAGSALGQEADIPSQGLLLPFSAGETWYVCQGYLGGISHGDDFALDLTRNPAGFGFDYCGAEDTSAWSANRPVLAPANGKVSYHLDDMVCLDLSLGGSLLIGHLKNRVAPGPVKAGALLGLVEEANPDNGGFAHIHIEAMANHTCTASTAARLAFSGRYRFFGVPDLPDLSNRVQSPPFINQYYGTGLSNLGVSNGSDDAGGHYSNCVQSLAYNEVYLGRCDTGANLWSGFRFEDLPARPGSYVSAGSLVFTTDGIYSGTLRTLIRAEASSQAAPFGPGNMPVDRQGGLTAAVRRWDITDTWFLGATRDTPNLGPVLQEVVNRGDWIFDDNAVALLTSAGSSTVRHRRVIARERDPQNLPPARLVVTQFKTESVPGQPKGNNLPVASAGPERIYTGPGQKVVLDGSASFDPDHDTLTYQWSQVSGPPVALQGANTPYPWFYTGNLGETYVFALTVTDSGWKHLRSTSTVNVRCSCG